MIRYDCDIYEDDVYEDNFFMNILYYGWDK